MDSNADGDYYLSNLFVFLTDPIGSLAFLTSIINPAINWGIVVPALGAIILLIIGSALVSGSEVAFFSLRPKQVRLLHKEHSVTASRILQLIEEPRYLLATILIANNIFNISIVITSYLITKNLFNFPPGQEWLEVLITTVFATFILVLLGEVMPKVYATHKNLTLARITAFLLSVMSWLFRPISVLLVRSTTLIEQKLDDKTKAANIDMKEIDQAIDIVANEKETNQQGINMLKGIVQFRDTIVTQIMRNRMDIFAIDATTSFDKLLESILEEGYSRVPVFEDSLDNIKGILYAKDLLQHLDKAADFDWLPLLRKPLYVPDTKKINELMKDMQSNRTHLAIIVNEYGGTEGLVTLEDILEEIVGEIKDEFDTQQEIIFKKIDRNKYNFDGKTSINDVCRVMKVAPNTFDEVKGDSDSLAGLLLELSGNFPDKDEEFKYKHFNFKILSIESNRIENVRVQFLPQEAAKVG